MSSTPHGCALHLEEDMAKVWTSIDSWEESSGWPRWSFVWKEEGSLGKFINGILGINIEFRIFKSHGNV